jgi:hypothetical protein
MPILLCMLERCNLNHWTTEQVCPSLHLTMETDAVSKTLCFLVFRIQDIGKVHKLRILSSIQIFHKPFDSISHCLSSYTTILALHIMCNDMKLFTMEWSEEGYTYGRVENIVREWPLYRYTSPLSQICILKGSV